MYNRRGVEVQDEQQDQSSREGQPTGPGLRAAQEGRDDPPDVGSRPKGPRPKGRDRWEEGGRMM